MEDKNSKIKLCYKKKYTIGDYEKDKKEGNRKGMAEFIYERFNERYIEPFDAIIDKKKKNGFSLMAISCLMIEALETFWQGLDDSRKKENKEKIWGGDFFEDFFSHCDELREVKGIGSDFYRYIRCGILHQAETTGGWKISRKEEAPLLERATRTVNATKFFNQLKKYLKSYRTELETQELNSDIWVKFNKKMGAIISNCVSG